MMRVWLARTDGATRFYGRRVPITPHFVAFPLPAARLFPLNEPEPVKFRRSGINPEQIAAVDLVGHVGQFIGHPIGDDDVSFGLERSQIAHHPRVE